MKKVVVLGYERRLVTLAERMAHYENYGIPCPQQMSGMGMVRLELQKALQGNFSQ